MVAIAAKPPEGDVIMNMIQKGIDEGLTEDQRLERAVAISEMIKEFGMVNVLKNTMDAIRDANLRNEDSDEIDTDDMGDKMLARGAIEFEKLAESVSPENLAQSERIAARLEDRSNRRFDSESSDSEENKLRISPAGKKSIAEAINKGIPFDDIIQLLNIADRNPGAEGEDVLDLTLDDLKFFGMAPDAGDPSDIGSLKELKALSREI